MSKHQCKVLKSIAIKGSDNIQRIQIREGLHYPTTNRAIKKLTQQGLIWLSKVGERGPKSPQTYSLTPLGVVGSITLCGLQDRIEIIQRHWSKFVPRFVVHWWDFEKKGVEIMEIASQVYLELSARKNTENVINHENILIIYRNSLDVHFLTVLVNKHNVARLFDVLTIIKENPSYYEVWKKWFGVQSLKMSYLKTLNEEIIQ